MTTVKQREGVSPALDEARVAERPDAPDDQDGAVTGGFLRRMFDAMSIPNFRLLYFGNLMMFASMQMQMFVRGVLVYQLTGSFTMLGVMSLANAIPSLLFAPVAGLIVDSVPRKTIIQSAQMFNAVNAGVLAVLAAAGMLSVEHLIITAVLQGVVNSTMLPARQSIISDLVGPRRLMNAVAMSVSGQNLMNLVGPGLGAAALAFLNPAGAFWVMAGLYMLAVTFTMRLPKRPLFSVAGRDEPGGVARRRPAGFGAIFDGIRYVAQERTIRTLIAVNFLIIIASMPYAMMLPGFVQEVLHRGPAEQGVLLMISGVGAIAGSLLIASMSSRNRGRAMIVVGIALGLSLLAFSISTNYFVTMPIMLFLGIASAARQSLGQVLIQSYAASEYRGRVMSVWFMQFSVMAFGTFGLGLLAEWFGPQRAIGGMAVMLVAMMILVTLFVPRMRRMQ